MHCNTVDYVLVYEEDLETIELKKQGTLGAEAAPTSDTTSAREKREMWRQKFFSNLRKEGIEMEEVSCGRRISPASEHEL
jgi:hypothetical protein